MFKRAKVVMLPTTDENPVNVPFLKMPEKQKLVKHLAGGQFRTYLQVGFKPQHLYFFSDDKIEESDLGCWVINKNSDTLYQLKNCTITEEVSKHWNKVIATTDRLIIGNDKGKSLLGTDLNNYLPQPSQSFIEKFIEEYNKGNIITDILVEYEEKQHFEADKSKRKNPLNGVWYESKLKINSKDNTITIKKVKDSWNREEVVRLVLKMQHDFTRYKEEFHFVPNMREIAEWSNNWIEENL